MRFFQVNGIHERYESMIRHRDRKWHFGITKHGFCGNQGSSLLYVPLLYFIYKDIDVVENSDWQGRFTLPSRYHGSEDNVWIDFIELAEKYKPLNLDLGFPDFAPPKHISQALADVAASDDALINQYTRAFGHGRLVRILAKLYGKVLNREMNPLTEILIGTGAHEALFAAILGHVHPGEQVIIIEPYFDSYLPIVKVAGGVPRFISLKPKNGNPVTAGDFALDPAELTSLFNEKTKMIILNTPHNPLGKVFSEQELLVIADLCKKWNVLCLSDEVYEWLVYKPFKHVRIASLPGMWDRTITVGSAGKTFSITGWKIGWAYGPANLIRNLQIVHQDSIYTCCTPMQEAIARAFELEFDRFGTDACYLQRLPRDLEPKKDMMIAMLKEVGLKPIIPQGGYFTLADWTPIQDVIDFEAETGDYKDIRFAKWMTKNIGVQGIPPSAFYSQSNKHLGENFIRICFIKKDENLEKAATLLRKWKKSV